MLHSSQQGAKNPGCQLAVVSTFCRLAPGRYEPAVWNLASCYRFGAQNFQLFSRCFGC